MISKNIKESWEFYIKYSKEHYPKEYENKDFDVHKKEWVEKVIKIEKVEPKKKPKRKPTLRALKIKEFKKIREEILKRDNYKCVECGSDYDVEVHHRIELSKDGTNSPDNLITLCHICHLKKHKGEKVYNLMKSRPTYKHNIRQ